eukprot:7493494-Pyramimonas_sp.AAC.1
MATMFHQSVKGSKRRFTRGTEGTLNREAVRKYRQRKKEQKANLDQEMVRLREENCALREQVKEMRHTTVQPDEFLQGSYRHNADGHGR